jgi:hypothetical protein
MDVNAYCDILEKQLADWKARLYDMIHIVDKLSEGEKETVSPSIRGLHSILNSLDGLNRLNGPT